MSTGIWATHSGSTRLAWWAALSEAGDGRLARKTRVLGALAAQQPHIPSGLAGLALFVKGVARTGAGDK